MKLRFTSDYLDFKEGSDYEVSEILGKDLIGKKVAKEVTAKGSTATKEKAPAKVKEQKTPVETKELKTPIETK